MNGVLFAIFAFATGSLFATYQVCSVKSDFLKDFEQSYKKLPNLQKLIQGSKDESYQDPYKSFLIEKKGVIGKTFVIQEESLLEVIQQKLKRMEGEGTLEGHKRKIQQKVVKRIRTPHPVQGIQKADKSERFFYNPTFTVEKTLFDHKGQVIHLAGTRINPLHHFSFGEPLIFIDGNDPDQVAYAKNIKKREGGQITLVRGSPLDLGDIYQDRFYFDQSGSYTRKLGITKVPAIVRQKGDKLEIQVVPV